MICPECKKEINAVNIVSTSCQIGLLDGDTVQHYVTPNMCVTMGIECTSCWADIKEFVKVAV